MSKPYVAEGLQGAADGHPVEQVGDDLRDRRHGDETTPYPPIGGTGALPVHLPWRDTGREQSF